MLLPILKQLGKIVKTAEQGNGRISHEGVFLVCGYMWILTQAMPDLGNSPSIPSQRPANLKNRPQQVPLPIRFPKAPNQGKEDSPGVPPYPELGLRRHCVNDYYERNCQHTT